MAEKEIKKEKVGFRARAADYVRRHRRATRVELVLLALVFLFFEFAVPTILSSRYSKLFFEKHLSDTLNYPVTFDHVNTILFGRPMVRVGGFTIRDHTGQSFFTADDVKMELSPWSLVRGRIVITRIHATDGNFYAARLPATADKPGGRWNVSDLVVAGIDPDHAIDLQTAAVELRNVVVTFQDQALPVPLVEHVRLRDFSISSLDIRRKTRLRVDAIDDDHPEASLSASGTFAVFVPEDVSTLSGHLELSLNHFNLQILSPYLASSNLPVVGWEGVYDLDLKMEGQGSSPLPVVVRSKVSGLRLAFASTRPEQEKPVAPRRADSLSGNLRADGNATRVTLGQAFLEGTVNVTADEIRSEKLSGELAQNRFEVEGRLSNLQTMSPRIEARLTSGEFELVEPLRSLMSVGMNEFARRVFSGVTGSAQADLKWTGKLEQAAFGWRVALKKARYHDPQYGFDLKDVAATIQSNGKKTLVDSWRAQFFDARIDATGSVDEHDRMALDVSVGSVPLAQFFPYLKVLRSRGYLSEVPVLDRVPAANGSMQGRLHIEGRLDDPDITGTVTLGGVRVQLAGVSVPLDNLRGHIFLDDKIFRARQLTGALGDSVFEVEGSLARATLTPIWLHLKSPRMNLRHSDELVSAGWMDPLEFPGVGRIRQADGIAAVDVNYRSDTGGVHGSWVDGIRPASSQSGGDAASGFTVQLQDAQFKVSQLALPLSDLSGGISFVDRSLRFDRFHGKVGESSFFVDGGVDYLNQPDERWNLKARAEAEFPQISSLFPDSWKNQLIAQGRWPMHVMMEGARQEGVHIEAGIVSPATSDLILAGVLQKPKAVPSEATFRTLWKDRILTLTDGKLLLSDLPLSVSGAIDLSPAPDVTLDLNVSLPQFAPVKTILNFVKLPESVQLRGGVASGSISLKGKLRDLEWSSSLRVADLSLAGMPWGMTSLTGDLTASRHNVSVKDFLAIVNNVPMRVTGGLSLDDPNPSLKLQVNNMNLDALVATIVRMSAAAEATPAAVAGKPLSIDVSASSGVFFHRPIKSFFARGTWKDGVLQIDPMDVTAGESFSRAHITWNARTNEQHMEFESRSVPMGAFLDEVLDLQIPVEAKLDVTANLTSHNPSPENLLASLEGKAHFEASKGTLQNSGLPQRLLSMAALVHEGLFGFNLGRIFQTIDPPKFKTFDRWSADVTFLPNQSAQLGPSEFKSDLFNLNASGTVNTKTEEMAINVNGSMPEISRGSNFLSQIFGRISVTEMFRNVRDFALLASGQRKRIKPRRHYFEFKLTGNVEGIKSIEDFHFTH
jgi:hypothetical protein